MKLLAWRIAKSHWLLYSEYTGEEEQEGSRGTTEGAVVVLSRSIGNLDPPGDTEKSNSENNEEGKVMGVF